MCCRDDVGRAIVGSLYDPNVEATLEKVARLAGQYERAVIAVVGHTDASMKGKGVRFEAVDMEGYDPETSIVRMGTFRGAWFRDSEGNLIAVGEGVNE